MKNHIKGVMPAIKTGLVLVAGVINIAQADIVPIAPVTVTNTVAAIQVRASVIPQGTNSLRVVAPYTWYDASGKVINQNIAVYSETNLASLYGTNYAGQKAAALALNGGKPWQISISTNGITASAVNIVSNKPVVLKWTSAQLAAGGIDVTLLSSLMASQTTPR